jgi:hypothetical protein
MARVQRVDAERQQTLPAEHPVRCRLPLDEEHLDAVARQQQRHGDARRPRSHDHNLHAIPVRSTAASARTTVPDAPSTVIS